MDAAETATLLRLMDSLGIAVLTLDDDDRAISWNETFLQFFPVHAGLIHPGEPYRDNLRRFYESYLGNEPDRIATYVDEGTKRHRGYNRRFEFQFQGRRLRVSSIQLPSGVWLRAWIQIDRGSTSEPRPNDALPSHMLDNIADGVIVIDERNVVLAANEEFRQLYGLPAAQVIVGSTLTAIIEDLWAEATEAPPADALPVTHHLRYVGFPFEIELPGERWIRVITHQSDDGLAWSSHSDITPLKRREEKLRQAEAEALEGAQQLRRAHAEMKALASTDMLTGLPNRRGFDAAFAEAWRAGEPLAVMVIDLDHFKGVNDRFGHPVGDECLKRIGGILRSCLRSQTDVAARFGGEEFCVLLPGATGVEALRVADAVRQGTSLADWSDVHVGLAQVTCSIGVCLVAVGSGLERADVLRVADEMLYRAKANGRNRVEITVRLSPERARPG